MKNSSFISVLKKQGYSVRKQKLGGGFTNDVSLITAKKGNQEHKYVLKKYSSDEDVSDMLRGYDAISTVVKTPTIVYREKNEVAYDFINGKSIRNMLLEKDPEVSKALILLANELEDLHNYKKANPDYKNNDSPDERKMIKDISKAIERGQVKRNIGENLVMNIRKYSPKNKSIIHGDAHLDNFIYSNGELYFIDTDNVKMSDYNADLGKIIYAIDELGTEGTISKKQSEYLINLFKEEYNGEDNHAINIYKARTPLIQLKHQRKVDISKEKINEISNSLESKVAVAAVLAAIGALLLLKKGITGNVVGGQNQNITPLAGIIAAIALVILIIYFVMRNKRFKQQA